MKDDKPPLKSSHKTLSSIRDSVDEKIDKLRTRMESSLRFSLPNGWHNVLHDTWQSTWEQSWQSVLPTANRLRQRRPVPLSELDAVFPYDVYQNSEQPYRYVGKSSPIFNFHGSPINVLTLSGGGANGAYGAGLLAGWTQRGSRPEFDLVMGVSTGAIIGFFAFMGMAFDDVLRYFYTELSTEDLVTKRMMQGLTLETSLFDTVKFTELVHHYVDDMAIRHLSEAQKKGRVLLVGTTNLDRSCVVTWDLTKIAELNHPFSRTLIRDVILASCAMPVAFPPVLLPVFNQKGEEYDEMHVDGGAKQQMLIHLPNNVTNVYAIINNRLTRAYQPVGLGVFDVANKALSSLISGSVTGDLHRLYTKTQRHNGHFSATWIDDDFAEILTDMFDGKYMRKLYEFGYQAGISGQAWQSMPPDFGA